MPPRLPDSVEHWPIDRLLPYVANARSHPEAQVAQIAGSIAEFGFNVPCLVDERGVLIAGHGRLLAAKRLGLVEIPVILLGHLSDAQARAFRIADNQIALNALWDDTVLAAELARLRDDGVDLDLLGFGEDDLDRLLDGLDGDGEGGQTDEDEVPKPPAAPVTRPGDLWVLGRHRLLCGEATNGAGVARLLDGAMPHLLISDPPYGAGNTMLSKEFPAGLLVITGANSAAGLRSMSARYLFLDEVDAYPPSAGEEGDPVALAEARTRTFAWRSKIFLTSTPTIHGVSRIEREFEAIDQRRLFVPCPHCGHDTGAPVRAAALGEGQSPRPRTMPARPVRDRSRSATRPR